MAFYSPPFPHFYADDCFVFIFCVSPLLCLFLPFPSQASQGIHRSLPLQLLLASLELEEGTVSLVPTPTP